MKKFVKFVKLPMLIICCSIFAYSIFSLIIVSCASHGRKYTYSTSDGLLEASYVFKNDEIKLEMSLFGEYTQAQTQYKIKDKKLYCKNIETGVWSYNGTIDAFEILISPEGNNFSIKLECKTNKVLRTLSIVGMSVFGVLSIGCVIVLILDIKGKIKYKENPEPSTENNQPNIEI